MKRKALKRALRELRSTAPGLDAAGSPPVSGLRGQGIPIPACAGNWPLLGDGEARNGFVRGLVASGLVAAMANNSPAACEAVRLALQGGTALATGIATANAVDRRAYGTAIAAIFVGAVVLKAINQLLPEQTSTCQNEVEK